MKCIPEENHSYNTRLNEEDLKNYFYRTEVFKYFFFPFAISDWNKFDLLMRKDKILLSFKAALLKINRPIPDPPFNIYKPVVLKLLPRLQVRIIFLNVHKFKYSFSNCVNPLYCCSLEVELMITFFLPCLCFSSIFKILLNELNLICPNFADLPDLSKADLLPYGSSNLNCNQNSLSINASIDYALKFNCFNGKLFWFYSVHR